MKKTVFPLLLIGISSLTMAQKSHWRAVIDIQGHELPFGLEFSKVNNREVAYIHNADEIIEVNELSRKGDSICMRMPVFDSDIKAVQKGDTIKGFWYNYPKGKIHRFSAHTVASQSHSRFGKRGNVTRDFSGKWEVDFSKDSPDSSKAIALFKVEGNVISGTFLTPTGDYRYLQGNVQGDSMWLSCFDGTHAFIFSAGMMPNGVLNGIYRSGASWNEPWTARRNEHFELPDPDKLTYLKAGYEKLDFSFKNLDDQQVSLSDSRYKGKVVIVQLMGSWCPNCMDETAYLAPYYKKYSKRGLEIIGLAYERAKEPEKAKANLKRLKERFGVEYEVLLAATTSDKEEAAKTLPMLNQVLGYPTTIFIDRKGKVRRIYTGYNGPATGRYYEKSVKDFEFFVDTLLKE